MKNRLFDEACIHIGRSMLFARGRAHNLLFDMTVK